MFRATLLTLTAAALLLLAACSAPTATTPAAPAQPTTAAPPKAVAPTTAPAVPTAAAKAAAPTTAPAAPTAAAKAAAPTTAPAAPTAAAKAAAPNAAAAAGAARVYKLVADGAEARFLVREQLANRNLPSDAVGRTKNVSGAIAIDPATGKVDASQSKFTVNIASLATDVSLRDGFIKRSVLTTDQFPNATFVVKEIKGLATPLPTSGDVQFQVVGDLTVRDVTKPITWDVTGKVDGNTVTGLATTAFKFGDFNLTQPRVPSVLSIEDNIRLEIDFKLTA